MGTDTQPIYKDELERFLIDLYTLIGIKISIFNIDGEEIVYYPNKYSGFCSYVRSFPVLNERCEACDKRAIEECKKTQKSQFYICHAGLMESFSPIMIDNTVAGYIVIGQSRNGMNPYSNNLLDEKRIDGKKLRSLFEKLPEIKRSTVVSAAHIVEVCAAYNQLKTLLYEENLSDDIRIEQYVGKNIQNEFGVEEMCEFLKISRRSLYRTFATSFKTTPAKYILMRRLSEACRNLSETKKSVKEIAYLSGFKDYGYFSRLFKSEYKMSAIQYRKSRLGEVKDL